VRRDLLVWLLGLATFALGGCNAASADENLCRAKITSSLLNPETAKFHDFRIIDQTAAKELMIPRLIKQKEEEEGQSPLPAPMVDQISKIPDYVFYASRNLHPRWATVRVRAEGKLGNTITSSYLCVTEDRVGCSCIDELGRSVK
jgi:hypothetical protein